MKKVMMIAALAAALVSCQSKGTQNNDAVAMDESVMAVTGNDSSAVAVYEGILPAADGPGIQYVLSVDSVGPDGESGYTLVTTYLDAEGPEEQELTPRRRVSRRRRQQEENSHQADPERRGHSGVLRSSERHNPAPCQRQPAGSCE